MEALAFLIFDLFLFATWGRKYLVNFLFLLLTGTCRANCDLIFEEFVSICIESLLDLSDKDSGDGLVALSDKDSGDGLVAFRFI